jgi:hypothetical protein
VTIQHNQPLRAIWCHNLNCETCCNSLYGSWKISVKTI